MYVCIKRTNRTIENLLGIFIYSIKINGNGEENCIKVSLCWTFFFFQSSFSFEFSTISMFIKVSLLRYIHHFTFYGVWFIDSNKSIDNHVERTFLFSLYWIERNDHNSDFEHSRWASGQRDKIRKFTEYELNCIIIVIHIVCNCLFLIQFVFWFHTHDLHSETKYCLKRQNFDFIPCYFIQMFL